MEKLQPILITPGLEVYHDVAQGWLYTRWLGVHTEASIQEVIDTVCIYLRGNAYTKILSDHSGLVGRWPEEVPWEMGRYFDALAAQGITYFAWVYNESHHNRILMEQALRSVKRPAVATFKDVASAYEWLSRCVVLPVANPGEQGEAGRLPLFS